MNIKVGVLDYGVGNIGSVMRALEELCVSPILIDRASDMHVADRLILPGVGSFTDCKNLLDKGGWTSALKDEVIGSSKPILGICLGMQLLADVGMEGAVDENGTAGLGFISGKVVGLASIGCESRIPHMGWNSIIMERPSGLLSGIPIGTDFYFVHSYAFVTESPKDTIAVTNYDVSVTAAIAKDNVWGVQFHPEKSSRAGFKLLRNFLEDSSC